MFVLIRIYVSTKFWRYITTLRTWVNKSTLEIDTNDWWLITFSFEVFIGNWKINLHQVIEEHYNARPNNTVYTYLNVYLLYDSLVHTELFLLLKFLIPLLTTVNHSYTTNSVFKIAYRVHVHTENNSDRLSNRWSE